MSTTQPLPPGSADEPGYPSRTDRVAAAGPPPAPEDVHSQRAPDELYYPPTRENEVDASDATREVPAYRDEVQGHRDAAQGRREDSTWYDDHRDGTPVTDTTGAIDTRASARPDAPEAPELPASAIPAARTPLSTPPVAVAGVLLALSMIVASLAFLHDFLVEADVLQVRNWSDRAIAALDGLRPREELTPLGIAAVVVGVLLLVLALWPRRRTHVPLSAGSSVYVRPKDVDLLASSAAEAVPGVLQAESKVTGRRVRVTVVTTADQDERVLRADVTRVVQERLAALSRRPRVKVRTDIVGGTR